MGACVCVGVRVIVWVWVCGCVCEWLSAPLAVSGRLHDTYKANSRHATLSSHHIMAPFRDSLQSIPGVGNIHTLCTCTGC